MYSRLPDYFCPVRIQWLKPTNALVESLRAFPFLDSDATIDGLKAELPAYLAATEDVAIPTEVGESEVRFRDAITPHYQRPQLTFKQNSPHANILMI